MNFRYRYYCHSNDGVYLNDLDKLPDDLYRRGSVRILHLENCRFGELPAGIGSMTGLTALRLSGEALEALPEDLGELRHLAYLSIAKSSIKKLPESIGNLRNLQKLDLSDNPYLEYPAWIWNLPRLDFLGCAGTPAFHKNIQKHGLKLRFVNRIKTSPQEQRQSLYLLSSQEADLCREVPTEHLFAALSFDMPEVRSTAHGILESRAGGNLSAFPLTEGSVLLCLGKLPDELQKQLKARNVKTLKSPSKEKYSHILLGERPKPEQLRLVATSGKPFLFVKQIQDFIYQQHLPMLRDAEADLGDQVAFLKSLVESLKPGNIDLALQLMESNGMPEGMITDLLFLSKNEYANEVQRSRARWLLKLQAPATLIPLINSSRRLTKEYFYGDSLDGYGIKYFPAHRNPYSSWTDKLDGYGIKYYLGSELLPDWRRFMSLVQALCRGLGGDFKWGAQPGYFLNLLPERQAVLHLQELCLENKDFVLNQLNIKERRKFLQLAQTPGLRHLELGGLYNNTLPSKLSGDLLSLRLSFHVWKRLLEGRSAAARASGCFSTLKNLQTLQINCISLPNPLPDFLRRLPKNCLIKTQENTYTLEELL